MLLFLYPPLTYLQPMRDAKVETIHLGGVVFKVFEVEPMQ